MAFFQRLRNVAKVFINLNANNIVFEVIGSSKEIQEEILDLNRINQLFKKGIDSNEGDLNKMTQSGFGYSQFTIEKKRKKGQPTDRVTLFDTGEFYKSFRLTVHSTYMQISADGQKDESNLFDDFGNDIVGLTEESISLIKSKILPDVQKYINRRLLAA
jgi:hypothetical protein